MYRRVLTSLLAAIFLSSLHSPTVAQVPDPVIEPDPPHDVEIPDGFSGDPVRFFDTFSWQTFAALNWPALTDQRGKPDREKEFGDQADEVVWGTWKADHEIFQPGGREPSEWDSFEAQSPDRFTSFANAGKTKILGGFGPLASQLQIEHYNQANPVGLPVGSLVSRNRQYVRYEIRINRNEFDFIRNGKFYLGSEIDAEVAANGQLVFPEGSTEIKAAWRVFAEEEMSNTELLNRFYRTRAVLVDHDGTRVEATVGLIGLHIVRRTASRPEWIWSSFEHVDNDTGVNSTLQVSNDPDPATWNKLLPVVDGDSPALPNPDPVLVKRIKPIRAETQEINDRWRTHNKIANTVWKNYRLVMTQWPRTPAADRDEFIENFTKQYPVGAGNPSPDEASGSSIANLTMETLSVFQTNSSCMRCHFNAGKLRKTEFVWTVPLRAFRESPEAEAIVLRDLRTNLEPAMRAIDE